MAEIHGYVFKTGEQLQNTLKKNPDLAVTKEPIITKQRN